MTIYPAIDIRGGRAVQLVGGVPGSERVVLDDPVAAAQHWVEPGFQALHVVDLDAALGHGDNSEVILRIIESAGVPVQVGGGVRSDETVRAWLEAGAARVIAGTRAVQDPDWLASMAGQWPGRVLAAFDVRAGRVLTRGWTEAAPLTPEACLERTRDLSLAGVLITDVSREGRLEGVDASRFADLIAVSPHPVLAAGGITSMADVNALAKAGAAGAVLGMALYTGAVDGRALAREFT